MSFSPRSERALNDAIHVANAIIDTLKGLLKERDEMIDELTRTNTRLQTNNQDHLNTITGMEDVIQNMEDRLNEQGQLLLAEKQKNHTLNDDAAIRASQLEMLTVRLSTMETKNAIWSSRAKEAEQKLAAAIAHSRELERQIAYGDAIHAIHSQTQ